MSLIRLQLQTFKPDLATLMAPMHLPSLAADAKREPDWRVHVEEMIDAFSSMGKFKYEITAGEPEDEEELREWLALAEERSDEAACRSEGIVGRSRTYS